MNYENIIIDTDPGIDDALAIGLACRLFKDSIKAVISSYGNLPLAVTHRNLLDLCGYFGLGCPVLRGSENPVSGCYAPADYIHGKNGLGGVILPQSNQNTCCDRPLHSIIKEYGTVTLITLGPLTNLAALLRDHPDIAENIERVVIMGGGIERYNIGDCAEFNIHCDVQSAAQVFSSRLNIHLVPLDITMRLWYEKEEAGLFCDPVLQKMIYALYESNKAFGDHGAIVHDGTTVMYIAFPELFETVSTGISISDSGKTAITDARSNVTLIKNAAVAQIKNKIYKILNGEL